MSGVKLRGTNTSSIAAKFGGNATLFPKLNIGAFSNKNSASSTSAKKIPEIAQTTPKAEFATVKLKKVSKYTDDRGRRPSGELSRKNSITGETNPAELFKDIKTFSRRSSLTAETAEKLKLVNGVGRARDKRRESHAGRFRQASVDKPLDGDASKAKSTTTDTSKDTSTDRSKLTISKEPSDTSTDKSKLTSLDKSKAANEDKSKDKSTEKSKDTITEKLKVKNAGKSKDTSTEKSKDTSTEKSKDTSTEKSKDTGTEKSKDTGTEKSNDRKTENVKYTNIEKSIFTSTEKLKDANTEKVKDRTTQRSKDRSIEKLTDTSIEKFKDTSIDKFKDTSIEKLKDASTERLRDPSKEKVKVTNIDESAIANVETEKDTKARTLKDISTNKTIDTVASKLTNIGSNIFQNRITNKAKDTNINKLKDKTNAYSTNFEIITLIKGSKAKKSNESATSAESEPKLVLKRSTANNKETSGLLEQSTEPVTSQRDQPKLVLTGYNKENTFAGVITNNISSAQLSTVTETVSSSAANKSLSSVVVTSTNTTASIKITGASVTSTITEQTVTSYANKGHSETVLTKDSSSSERTSSTSNSINLNPTLTEKGIDSLVISKNSKVSKEQSIAQSSTATCFVSDTSAEGSFGKYEPLPNNKITSGSTSVISGSSVSNTSTALTRSVTVKTSGIPSIANKEELTGVKITTTVKKVKKSTSNGSPTVKKKKKKICKEDDLDKPCHILEEIENTQNEFGKNKDSSNINIFSVNKSSNSNSIQTLESIGKENISSQLIVKEAATVRTDKNIVEREKCELKARATEEKEPSGPKSSNEIIAGNKNNLNSVRLKPSSSKTKMDSISQKSTDDSATPINQGEKFPPSSKLTSATIPTVVEEISAGAAGLQDAPIIENTQTDGLSPSNKIEYPEIAQSTVRSEHLSNSKSHIGGVSQSSPLASSIEESTRNNFMGTSSSQQLGSLCQDLENMMSSATTMASNQTCSPSSSPSTYSLSTGGADTMSTSISTSTSDLSSSPPSHLPSISGASSYLPTALPTSSTTTISMSNNQASSSTTCAVSTLPSSHYATSGNFAEGSSLYSSDEHIIVIVRDMSSTSHSINRTNINATASTTVEALLAEIGRKFEYEPDSFSLTFQHYGSGEQVSF